MRRAIEGPGEQVAFAWQFLSDLTDTTGAPVTALVRNLAQEIAMADELLIDLVRYAYLEQDPLERAGARDDVLKYVPPGVDVTTAASIATVWHHLDVFDLATRAATDAILTALASEKRPRSARLLGAVWHTAVDVRDGLRRRGAEAEVVAARLLEYWSAPLADLPPTAAAIAAMPSALR
jgi:hypothetical protein